MSRPRKLRCIAAEPRTLYYKPRGVPLTELEELRLGMEELEALRLAEVEGLAMEEAARAMGVSRHTFGRVLRNARRIVARALVGAYALRIEGGHYQCAHTGRRETSSDRAE